MSVLFGTWNFKERRVRDDLIKMRENLSHWNPDRQGFWEKNNIGLGHHLLINTPESRYEQQPLDHLPSGLTIVTDARIDNRNELLKIFKVPVERHDTTTDNWLILQAYLTWKINCVDHLLGDFSFVIWDSKEECLFCVRDQIGCKPFYYLKNDEGFSFASHQRGLLKLFGINLTPNYNYLSLALSAIVTPNTDTCYNEINRLPPAHYIIVTKDQFTVRRYWKPDNTKKIILSNDAEYLEAFSEKLHTAISRRMRTLFPVGSQLSGGLDSSGVTALAKKLCDPKSQSVIALTLGMSDYAKQHYPNTKDEVAFATKVVEHTGIKNHVIVTDELSDYWELINKQVELNGGVTGVNFTENSFLIGKAASSHNIRTILSGYPGDEGVTTHCSYLIPYLCRSGQITNQIPNLYKLFGLQGRQYLRICKHLLRTFTRNTDAEKMSEIPKNIINKTLVNSLWLGAHKSIEKDIIKALNHPNREDFSLSEDLWTHLTANWTPTRMESEHTASLAWKTETVYPLADLELLDFFAAIPATQKIRKGVSRWLFRSSMEGLLPKEIQWRTDKAYSVLPPIFALFRKAEFPLLVLIEKCQKKNYHEPFVDYGKLQSRWVESIHSDKLVRGVGSMMAALQFLLTFENNELEGTNDQPK